MIGGQLGLFDGARPRTPDVDLDDEDDLDDERSPAIGPPSEEAAATLRAAKAWLAERFEGGTHCPCCGLFVKLYRRKLNSGMAAGLCRMYVWHRENGWGAAFDSHDLIVQGRRIGTDFPLLRFWGLIVRVVEGERPADEAPRRTSRYRITEAGRRFVEGAHIVERYVFVFNDEPYARPCEETTTIHEALRDRFSYAELMGGVAS